MLAEFNAAQIIRFPDASQYVPVYNFDRPVSFDWFGYVFPTFSDIAVGATQQQQIIIQADSDFELRRICYHYTRVDAAFTQSTRPIPNISIQIQDSGSGRNLFNAAVPLTSIANGPDQQQRDMTWPKIFARNSTIVVQLTNFDAAVADGDTRLSFFGRKIYIYEQ